MAHGSADRVGALRRGRVTTADWERVGESSASLASWARSGFVSEGAAGNPPASVVVKPPSARDDVSFERHVRELRLPRARRPVRTEALLRRRRRRAAQVDPAARDLSAGRQGRQVLQAARSTMRGACSLRWGRSMRGGGRSGRGRRVPALRRRPVAAAEQYGLQTGFSPSAVRRCRQVICEIVERLGLPLVVVAPACARRRTLIHADLQLDNVLFDGRGDGLGGHDWQTVSAGPGGNGTSRSSCSRRWRSATDASRSTSCSRNTWRCWPRMERGGCSAEDLRLDFRRLAPLLVLLAERRAG